MKLKYSRGILEPLRDQGKEFDLTKVLGKNEPLAIRANRVGEISS